MVREFTPAELDAAVKLISSREEKHREVLREKTYWHDEYQLMREQIVEEKTRQVDLFHKLESQQRIYSTRVNETGARASRSAA
ncbi:hypothetical protein PINS_up019290 [Pythium insidiosum]|nr:hypothetical protein PINS_up019290 [Pythium insidiosum]